MKLQTKTALVGRHISTNALHVGNKQKSHDCVVVGSLNG